MQTKKFFQNNVSFTLIVINVVIFLFQSIIPRFNKTFGLLGSVIATEPWRLLTSVFMHVNFTHLLFNMYALLIFGNLIERKIGSKRFLIFYLIAGLVGSLAFAIYDPLQSAMGASGAIMGVLGLVILLLPKLRVLFFFVIPMSMRTAGIIFVLIDIVGFAVGGTNIGHVAHFAGLASGLGFGFYLLSKKKSFTLKFTANSSTGNSSVHIHKPKSNHVSSSYEKTIELTKDDLDSYYKYGKL